MANDGPKCPLLLLISALVGGGGVSAVAPKIAPAWYRPDPALGDELRELQRGISSLGREVRGLERNGQNRDRTLEAYLIAGPSEVRADQAECLAKLDQLTRDVAELRRTGLH